MRQKPRVFLAREGSCRAEKIVPGGKDCAGRKGSLQRRTGGPARGLGIKRHGMAGKMVTVQPIRFLTVCAINAQTWLNCYEK